jgi:small nuclear ribonucleoprotein (snRNP)-like protein
MCSLIFGRALQMSEVSANLVPSKFFLQLLSKPVFIKLNTGESFEGIKRVIILGTLLSVDGSMNMAISNVKHNKSRDDRLEHGFTFIRGNNGIICMTV